MERQWKEWQSLFSWAPKWLQMVTAARKLKDGCSLEEKLWQSRTTCEKAETLLCWQRSNQSYGFSSSHGWMWESDLKESWSPKNWWFWTMVLEKILESKDWCWSWNSNTLVTWREELTHWKRPWCWERFKARGKGDDRGRDGWMASPIQWTWVLVNSRNWWWAGKPGMLQSMELQKVRQDWVTELNWPIWMQSSKEEQGEIRKPS